MKTPIALLVLSSVLLCHTATGKEQSQRELIIGISFSIPPYVIAEENSGLELEILRQSFAIKGYTVLPSYLPLARTFMSFEEGSLDGVLNVKPGMVKGHYSDVVITFRNQAVSLKDRELSINRLEDLSQISVVAFQKATVILGHGFASAVQYNSDYNEVADQSLQVKQLFRHRTDVIILEKRIFLYFRRWLYDRANTLGGDYIVKQKDLLRPVIYHDIFPPSEYRFAFLSQQVRDDFNEGLQVIRDNGTYDRILKKYEEDLELPAGD
ncbi:hypothetical protein BTA51_13955 [Hahella sp. CCB-MM4]|uniref:hypothetical protein n=1 Tax=Hahella sp. (strain CCB-MM4) TaxID=1926491 RepID=UPI000B9A2A1B|nr:hypothetical protein [Hahella sp. CCB-MM4]OZG72629.1 hypothetical protein BTA51_13955 [Hahella sp. CCB-MM4]